jgi:outer membrane protein TolC
MKKFKITFLILLLSNLVFAQENITLEECQILAKQNYPLIKRNDLIAKTKQYNLENISKSWLPQININAQASYQSAVTEIPFKFPNLTINPLSKDQYKVYVDVNQSIYDGGITANQKKLAKVQSETELQKNTVEINKLEERINQIYFGILQTQEQINQIDISKNDVENGLKKAEVQLKYGTIFQSNVDVLKAQLISNVQQKIDLQSINKNFLEILSIFINKKLDENTALAMPQNLLLSKVNNRPELKVFDLQKQTLEVNKAIINSKNLPKIGAFLQAGYGKPGLNMLQNSFDTYYIGGLRLNIPITGFYTKKNDLALLETQQQEVEIQRENFLFNQNLSKIQDNNNLNKIQKLIETDDELITLRKSIKKASLAQLENGVITTSDYLREVNAEEQARISKTLHEMQFLSTQYNLKAELGN